MNNLRDHQILSYQKNLVTEMCNYYGIPETYELQSISQRRDVHVAFYTRMYQGAPVLLLQPQYLSEIVQSFTIPRMEAYYECKLRAHYFFMSQYNDVDSLFFVGLFDDQIFKGIGSSHANIEEKLANQFASYIKIETGRGPTKSRVSILDNKYTTVVLKGLISPYDIEFSADNSTVFVKEILNFLLRNAVEYIWKSEYLSVPDYYIEVDFEKNLALLLILDVPFKKNDYEGFDLKMGSVSD